ncbi:hypothetical protein RHSIM_Rhsim10G0160900 [Rhododendron simsii]|uniref:Uncharacterized protein n=1 Tax=Rhododendron simsii TaxID=118357 RepID=A0A834GEC6_RHOSS|nr:hypothetical protein RHSIM_Rhsim10G0160900 [Rhododendron simsii]
MRYLRGMIDLGLFYSNSPKAKLIGYADVGYLSDPHKSLITNKIKGGYIKGDRTKHISPKFFYTHDPQKSGDIDIQ